MASLTATPPVPSPPGAQPDWVGLVHGPLPVGVALEWAVLPSCGAVVVFVGTARDHAEGRPGVTLLEYEAYEEQVVPRLGRIAAEARRRWPDLGRLALLHRVGAVEIGEASVVVVASAPHRPEAFTAGRYVIDTLKATVPVWKREHWAGGVAWGLDACHVAEVGDADEDGAR